MPDASRPYQPRYQHLVWNRTDLTVSRSNLSASYSLAKPPLIYEAFPPAGFKGEIIPPYAALRVLTNPVFYKDAICWPVCRPDDNSMNTQQAGLHFFNGPAPIPVGGYGLATNDLPAPALVDITVGAPQGAYGNVKSTGVAWMGIFLGFASGDWALHPAADLVAYGSQSWLSADSGLAGGQTTMLATQFPYCVVGQHPAALSGKTPGPTDSPTVAFNYSEQLFWIGRGGLGFGSTSITA